MCVAALVPSPARSAEPASAPATTRAASRARVEIVPVDPKATLITAQLKDVPPARLFEAIGAPAGTTFETQPQSLWDEPPLAGERFSAEFERQPFWEALREACDATSVCPDPHGMTMSQPDPVTRLTNRPWRGPKFVDGPLLFRVVSLERVAVHDHVTRKRTGPHVVVGIRGMIEPRLRHVAWIDRFEIERATDDRGRSMVPARPPDPLRPYGTDLRHAPLMEVQLDCPPEPGAAIAELRGRVHVRLPARVLKIDVPWPPPDSEPIEVRAGANVLRVRDPKRQADRHEVELTLVREDPSEERWREAIGPFSQFDSSLLIRGAGGNATGPNSGSFTANGDEAVMRRWFPSLEHGDAAPWTLHFELPLEMGTMPATFEFKGLPLP